MNINNKLNSLVLASAVLILFLILVSSAASAATAQSASSMGPYAYITNYFDETVSVIDTATNTVTATIDVGWEPKGVAVIPDGKKVYVANNNDGTVSVIDTATNTVTATVDVGSNPSGLAVSPDEKNVYVTNNDDGTVSVIDTLTDTVTATVNIGSNPMGVAVTPDGKKAYVANSGDDDISIIDTATSKVKSTVNVGSWPYGIAVNFMGTKVYVTNTDSNTVSVIDTATNKVIATVPVGSDPLGVAVNPDETKVYVANNGNDDEPGNTVSVIDTATNKVVATVPVGSDPLGVAVTPDGKKVYVANENSNTVSVINTATNKVTATVEVGTYPIAFGQFIVPASVKPGFPVANFTSNVTKGYVPLMVKFTDLSENATSRNWDFGDGTNSTAKNPTHTYSSSGTYTVNLTAINAKGTGSKLGTITVFDKSVLPPVANFSSNVSEGYAPLSVKFTDKSKNATEWNWDFGDGDTSSERNPTHTYYVAGNYYVTLTAINAVDQSTKTSKIKVKISPQAGTYAYITNVNNISVIDTVTNKVIATVYTGDYSYPYGLAVSPDRTKVYLANYGSGDVSVIDTATNKVIATVEVGESTYGIAVSPDGKKVYVGNRFSNSVDVIDTATNTVTATVDVGWEPKGVAVTPDGTKVYVADFQNPDISDSGNTVSVIDTATNKVTALVKVGNYPYGVAVNPAGTKVYVTNDWNNTVSVIETATNKVVATVDVESDPSGITVTPDGKKVYVANSLSDNISVIDTTNNTVIATVPVGEYPIGVSVTPDGKKVYVANADSNTVSVIDTTTNKVTATINGLIVTDSFGQFIAPPPKNSVLPIANFISNTTKGYAPLSVKFTDLSESATLRNWNFGDGKSSTEKNPVHTYSKAGTYIVNLTITNDEGTDSKLGTITVFDTSALPPVANFISNVTQGNAPLSVKFTDKSKYATQWEWYFGDGTTSSKQNPTHTYSVAEKYNVTLTVTNAVGQSTKTGGVVVQSTSPTYAYIANDDDNTVSVIDTATNKVTATVPVGSYPSGVAITPDGTKVYVTNFDSDDVSVIDTTTNKVTATVPVETWPYGIAVSPDGKKVYVANEGAFSSGKSISVINTTTNTVVDTVYLGKRPCSIVITPNGKEVYVSYVDSNTLDVIDTATNKITFTLGGIGYPFNLAITPDGKKVYAVKSDSYSDVFVIDTATKKKIARIAAGNSSSGVAVNPAGTKVYVANRKSNDISVIDVATNKITATVPVVHPGHVEVNPAGTKVYVANVDSNTVSVIDTATSKVIDKFNVGNDPSGIAFSPSLKKVYPVANFTSNVTSGKAPLTVAFTDKSTGIPTKWNWIFGDGTNSTRQNPIHKYSKAGNYTVSLKVSNSAGNNTTTKTNYIKVTAATTKPVSNFISNVTSGKAPLNVAFTDKSTGSPTKRKWTFGDGTNSTKQNPIHKYSKVGNYTVTLTATNAAGSNKVTKSNYIKVTTVIKPVAFFSASPTSGKAPLKVTFTDKSTGSPTSWKWSFGDGSNSTAKNPAHTYSKAGKYTVSLTVKNAAGSNKTTKTNYINVTPLKTPAAAFSASPTSGNVPLKVKFTDKSTGTPTSWKWSFGDGTYSTSQNPAHTYSKVGKYTVSLTVKNAAGSNKTTKTNYINVTTLKAPVAAFSASPTSGKVPLKVQFTDKSTNSPTSWKWSFGDGKTSTSQNPAYTYSKAGNYTVSLTVKNAKGSNTKTISGYIKVSKK